MLSPRGYLSTSEKPRIRSEEMRVGEYRLFFKKYENERMGNER